MLGILALEAGLAARPLVGYLLSCIELLEGLAVPRPLRIVRPLHLLLGILLVLHISELAELLRVVDLGLLLVLWDQVDAVVD